MSETLRIFGNHYPNTPDGLIRAYESIREMEKAVADLKRDVTNRLVALAGDTDAKTLHVKGESYKAIITMPAQAYNQTALKELWRGIVRPEERDEYFSITSLRPLLRGLRQLGENHPLVQAVEDAKIAPYLLPTIKTSSLELP